MGAHGRRQVLRHRGTCGRGAHDGILLWARTIIMDGYGKPLNAKVEEIRVHSGSLFIKSAGTDSDVMPGEERRKKRSRSCVCGK